jgi:uncharacterized protein (TIGR00255 family)
MTGYGRAAATAKGQSVVVEIRTVNHRFLELKLRGPFAGALEDQVAARVRKSFERGSVVASLSVSASSGGGAGGGSGESNAPRVDRARAHHVFRELSELAAELGLPPPGLAEVLAAPAVISAGGPAELADEAAVLALVEAAVVEAAAMRQTEGATLCRDLTARFDHLVALTAELTELASQGASFLAERLNERLRKLLAQLAPAGAETTSIDPGRLAQEVALLADRADITEELVRLASHLEQAKALLVQPGALGRRLEFLLQELGRELNTIGAKSWSSAISTRIVEAKSELEKLREQAQNVE